MRCTGQAGVAYLEYSFATLGMALACAREYSSYSNNERRRMCRLFLKLISNEVVWVYVAFSVAVIFAVHDSTPQITLDAQRGVHAYLAMHAPTGGGIERRCNHEMLMFKNGSGFWEYEKPQGSTGRAVVKCK